MPLVFRNTMTRRDEEFVPITPGKVGLYTCGPTVYDYAHIGNYRAYIFEDLLVRWLEFRGYDVTQVMNLTDVDDKTIRRSREEGIPLGEYTKRYKDAFFEDIDTLRIGRAEVYPAATEHIPQMVAMIKRLIENGYAYRGDDGSWYYSIRKFTDYGKLSGKVIDELQAGARISSDDYSKDEAYDFALWKAYSPEDGNVFWETELGKGRPGWHIECSAMSTHYLGNHFDMHTGGVDNIFPHHENEIAQSEGANGEKFVNYWLHCEHLIVEGRKMSKSLGNFYTLRQILEMGYSPLAVRYLLISTHYRKPLNFTFDGLKGASAALDRLWELWRRAAAPDRADGDVNPDLADSVARAAGGWGDELDNDLGIAGALGHLFDFVRIANRIADENGLSAGDCTVIKGFLRDVDKVLDVIEAGANLEAEIPTFEFDGRAMTINEIIAMRTDARAEKNFARADEIRDFLRAQGVELKDTPKGTEWKKLS